MDSLSELDMLLLDVNSALKKGENSIPHIIISYRTKLERKLLDY